MYYTYLYMYIPFIEDLDLPQETLRTSVESCHNSPVIDPVVLVTVGCGWCSIAFVYAGGSDSGGDGSGAHSNRLTVQNQCFAFRAHCTSLLVSDPSSLTRVTAATPSRMGLPRSGWSSVCFSSSARSRLEVATKWAQKPAIIRRVKYLHPFIRLFIGVATYSPIYSDRLVGSFRGSM